MGSGEGSRPTSPGATRSETPVRVSTYAVDRAASGHDVWSWPGGISFPGKPSLKGDIAQRDAERLEQEYHATPFRLIARFKWASVDRHIVTLLEEGSR